MLFWQPRCLLWGFPRLLKWRSSSECIYTPATRSLSGGFVVDITAFSISCALAIGGDGRPQLMACCALADAVFARFPPPFVAFGTLYAVSTS